MTINTFNKQINPIEFFFLLFSFFNVLFFPSVSLAVRKARYSNTSPRVRYRLCKHGEDELIVCPKSELSATLGPPAPGYDDLSFGSGDRMDRERVGGGERSMLRGIGWTCRG